MKQVRLHLNPIYIISHLLNICLSYSYHCRPLGIKIFSRYNIILVFLKRYSIIPVFQTVLPGIVKLSGRTNFGLMRFSNVSLSYNM